MAEQICKVITCDRCGGSTFLALKPGAKPGAKPEAKAKVKAVDGSHTVLESFEPMPTGWRQCYDIDMLLCPECSAAYAEALKGFEKGGSNE